MSAPKTETYPQLEVPLLELASDVLDVRNVPWAFNHGLQVLGSPPHLKKKHAKGHGQSVVSQNGFKTSTPTYLFSQG